MTKELMPWAQEAADAFYRDYGNGNCSCHISPPCYSCTHEGNPLNLENDPEAWGELHEVMAAEAVDTLAMFIDVITARHLAEMAATKKVGAVMNRLGFQYLAKRPCGRVSAMCWDEPGYEKSTAKDVKTYIDRGDTVERVERFEGDKQPDWICEECRGTTCKNVGAT